MLLATAPHTLAQPTSGRYVVGGTGGVGLTVRAAPSAEGALLGVLPDGAAVNVTDGPVSDGESDWLYVQAAAGEDAPSGWCRAAYLLAPAAADDSGAVVSASFVATVTAYASGEGGGRIGSRTASGTRTHWGTVAADTRLYPFGTRLTIEGFEGTVFVVEDTGSGVHGQIFDVWFPDQAGSAAFGTQKRRVTVLGGRS